MPAQRLPPITAALVIEMVGLEVFRNQFGMRDCLTRGIGPRRKLLGPSPPEVDTTTLDIAERARDQARTMLKGMCMVCPFKHCKMKTWGMD